MFKGVGNEWLPTFGVSWQVPHVPVSEGIPPLPPKPPANTSSLMPATPVILIGLELKMTCPRATAGLGDVWGSDTQASNGLKIAGVNWPSPGVTRPPGCSNCGSKKWTLEFMVIKNGCVVSATGPPVAPCASNRPV